MLADFRDRPAGTGPDAPARAGRMLRFARAVQTRWRAVFLLTGAVLTPPPESIQPTSLTPGLFTQLAGGLVESTPMPVSGFVHR
jgi:hypothetical protein